jgi:hypothetical protein
MASYYGFSHSQPSLSAPVPLHFHYLMGAIVPAFLRFEVLTLKIQVLFWVAAPHSDVAGYQWIMLLLSLG